MDNERPNVSHKLADATIAEDVHNTSACIVEQPEKVGTAITDNGKVKDLGWHEVGDSGNLPEPLIGKSGLGPDPDDDQDQLSLAPVPSNEELFTLIRRFNKQMSHVKCTHSTPLTDLDLEIARQEVFTPIKFRTHLERFYMTVFVGLVTLYKHLIRIRSWREYRRTSVFLLVYSAAWTFDCLLSTIFTLLLILAIYPPSRAICFPHVAPALIDGQTGDLKKPMANVLASDSMTGAPESHPGEAIEQEAHSFGNSIIELAIGMASGESPEDIANIKDKTGGEFEKVEHDKTKKPVSDAVWEEALPVMHMIANVADIYERFANALEPRWPFSKDRPKLILAGVLVPIILGSWFLTSYMLIKSAGLLFGFILFGDPVITRISRLLDSVRPGWRNFLSLSTTILRGIPTDAQYTLTLLRIGERNCSPIPPPPGNNDPLPMDAHPTAGQGLDKLLNVSPQEVNATIQPTAEAKDEADGDLRERTKSKGPSRIIAGLKHAARGMVNTVRGVDRLSAHVKVSQSARYRAGVVRTGPLPARCSGPVRFPARRDGKRGYAVIFNEPVPQVDSEGLGGTLVREDEEAVLGWVRGEVPEEGDEGAISQEGERMEWRISIADVYEIQKIGGLGWKSKILVGWATDGEITDGLVIRDEAGTEYHLTAISLRDELFNRLVAIGGQMWEAW